MATNNKLKAYVRYDGTGRVIAGSLILQRSKPKVGNWKEIPANECCNPTTTTTTTDNFARCLLYSYGLCGGVPPESLYKL